MGLEELKVELIAIKRNYIERIEKHVRSLEENITKDLVQEMRAACEKHETVYLGYFVSDDGYGENGGKNECGIQNTAELFVNNQIIQLACDNDPAADWDGSARAEDLEKYITPDWVEEEEEEETE